jgi:hypothetical protein
MRCPLCETPLVAVGIICPNCKIELPTRELIPIYRKILHSNRDLANAEKRQELDRLAIDEFELRKRLVADARLQAAEAARLENLEKQRRYEEIETEKLVRKSKSELKRKKVLKKISFALAGTLLCVSIAGGVKITLDQKEKSQIKQDCTMALGVDEESRSNTLKALIAIDGIAYSLSWNYLKTNFDFRKASAELNTQADIISKSKGVITAEKVRDYFDSLEQKISLLTTLVEKGKPGQNLRSIKSPSGSTSQYATEIRAMLENSPCVVLSQSIISSNQDPKLLPQRREYFLINKVSSSGSSNKAKSPLNPDLMTNNEFLSL